MKMTHEQIQGVYAIYTTKKCEKMQQEQTC